MTHTDLADLPVTSYLYSPRTLISRKKSWLIRQANMLSFITSTLCTSDAAHAAIVAQSKFYDTQGRTANHVYYYQQRHQHQWQRQNFHEYTTRWWCRTRQVLLIFFGMITCGWKRYSADLWKISKYNIESLFLALIASNIIDWEFCNNKIIWILQRYKDDQFMFEQDVYWLGINTFSNDYMSQIKLFNVN